MVTTQLSYFYKEMVANKGAVIALLLLAIINRVAAQSSTIQQGIVLIKATSIRLADVQVRNKRNLAVAKSNLYGMFSVAATAGDTLEMLRPGYNSSLIVSDLSDIICFLEPAIALPEVVIEETSVKTDLIEVKKGYRRKSVFYTGTPHYYYVFLKPMTFIYENFKSEVIDARKFNRFAKDELSYQQIISRFNDGAIKRSVPIRSTELEDFESTYWPSAEQLNGWSDYDLSTYIIRSYRDYTARKTAGH